jgi:putative ABC transport system permease protein
MNELWRRLLFLFRRRQFECDLEEEMRFHLEMKARQSGSMAAARRQFGNAILLREDSRAAWGWGWLEALWRDVLHGLRLYRRSPGFTAVAVLTLGLGLGVNIAIFTLLYNVVLRPLPYPDPSRLVKVYVTWNSDDRGVPRDIGFSYPKFQELRHLSTSFQSLAAYGSGSFDLVVHPAERVRGEFVSSAYFPTLGITAALGRTFLPQEDAAPGAAAVAVIADSLWKRRFASDPAIIGREIRFGTVSLRVAGVAPPGFTGETGRAELWVPITMAPLLGKSDSALTFPLEHWHMVVGRLKPAVTRAQAAAEVAAIMRHVELGVPPGGMRGQFGSGLIPLAESRLEPAQRKAIFVLYAAVGFVLLIACGNLANLTMARMVGRRREVAMRLALGAGRGALIRQFLAENVLLSLAGGAAGMLLASWSARLLVYLRPQSEYATWPSYLRTLDPDALHLTAPVLGFSIALALACGLLFGLAPALRASRGDVNAVLKQGAAGAAEPKGRGFRGPLLPAQIALAVVLLAAATLMMRSFARLVTTPVGAEIHNVLAFEIVLPDYKYTNRNMRRGFLDRVAETLQKLPGVDSVALAEDVPALERENVTSIQVPNRPGEEFVGGHYVDPGFFALFRIPLRAGRLFTDHDRQTPSVILSERAAAALFPGRNPIGMHIEMGEDREVIGVVGEVRYAKQKQQLPLIGDAYLTPARGSSLVAVRAARNPNGLIAPVRHAIAGLDPDLPAYNLRTLEDQASEANWGPRFAAVLLGFFAALALALALVGIYGVFSYAVATRTREFGIRIASGARTADIVWLVLREGALLCGAGLVVGIPATAAATRLLGGILYEPTPSDPFAYIATSLLLAATALAACLVPAYRAARVDPVVALRCE